MRSLKLFSCLLLSFYILVNANANELNLKRELTQECQEYREKLRSLTPNDAVRKKFRQEYKGLIEKYNNASAEAPVEDFVIPGYFHTKPVSIHADHVVPVSVIMEMDGFADLTCDEQLKILNHFDNFTPLTKTANSSKGTKSYEEWTTYIRQNLPISLNYRSDMQDVYDDIQYELQEMIHMKNNQK